MKAQKVTVKIEMEALSVDVLRGLLEKVLMHVESETENGQLSASDGDSIKWSTTRKDITF